MYKLTQSNRLKFYDVYIVCTFIIFSEGSTTTMVLKSNLIPLVEAVVWLRKSASVKLLSTSGGWAITGVPFTWRNKTNKMQSFRLPHVQFPKNFGRFAHGY